jgi:hypothetical protein
MPLIEPPIPSREKDGRKEGQEGRKEGGKGTKEEEHR